MPYVVEPLNSGGFAINGPDGKPVCVLTRTEDPFAMADRLNESEDRLAVAQMLQAELKAQINAHQATLGRVIPLRLALLQAVPALATPPGPGEKSPRSAVWEGVRLLLADLAAASDSHAKALADPKALALYRDPVEGEGLTPKDT